jgi:integrator complex subunit 6
VERMQKISSSLTIKKTQSLENSIIIIIMVNGTTIVFVVDTSSSMNQKTVNGMSLLDVAKSAIEHFIKIRTRQTHGSNQDRYLLVTCATTISQAIKIGWKESTNSHTFLNTLKNLEANDLTTLGLALKRAFDLLNQFRLHNDTDTYGRGRYPHRVEPQMVIVFTDGNLLTSTHGVSDTLVLPNPQTYSSQLTIEPFRWEQRVFSCALKFPSISIGSSNSTEQEKKEDQNAVSPISEVTGGQSRTFIQMSQVLHYMEELSVACSQTVVVANFEIIKSLRPISGNPTDNVLIPSPRTILYIPTTPQQQPVGFWPIPENYYPDTTMTVFPPRTAHPTIYLQYIETDFLQTLQRNKFPCVDTYEVDLQSALGKHLLSGTTSQHQGCYKAFVMNSGGRASANSVGPYGEPFGFVRKVYMPGTTAASQNPADQQNYRIFLYVLPYNFLRFFYLIDELIQTQKGKPNQQWKQNFEKYVKTLPPYYINPLKNALKRYNIPPQLFPEHVDGSLPYSLNAFLKKMKKQEKLENERLTSIMQQQFQAQSSVPIVRVPAVARESSEKGDDDFRSLLQRSTLSSSSAGNSTTGSSSATSSINDDSTLSNIPDEEGNDIGSTKSFSTGLSSMTSSNTTTFTSQMSIHRNPFDITRSNLMQQLQNMSLHLYQQQSIFSKTGIHRKNQTPNLDVDSLAKLSKQEIQKHSVPINQMGNFDEVLRKRQVLRDPLAESKGPNQVNFGSPFQRKRRRSRSPVNRRHSNSQQQNAQDEGNSALLGDEMEIIEMKEEEEADELKRPTSADKTTDEVSSPIFPLDTGAAASLGTSLDDTTAVLDDSLPVVLPLQAGNKRRRMEDVPAVVIRYEKAKQQEVVSSMVNNGDPEVARLMKTFPNNVLTNIYERTQQVNTIVSINDKALIQAKQEILGIIRGKSLTMNRLNTQWQQQQQQQSARGDENNKTAEQKKNEITVDQINTILNKIAGLKFANVQCEKLFLRDIICWSCELKKYTLAEAITEKFKVF